MKVVPRWLSRPGHRDKLSAPDRTPGGSVPWWVPIFTDWGRPLAAVVVLVLCAPGEKHLADLVGWDGWLTWLWAGLLSLYAGISAVVATVRPRGTRGKATAVLGAALSLALAMAAQPISHMFTTGYLTADPRPPLWLVITVSGIPPFILGHLLHLAASAVRPAVPSRDTDTGQDAPQTRTPDRTRLRPRPVTASVPAAVTAPVSRPAVPPSRPVLSLTKGQDTGQSAGRPVGQIAPKQNLSARALELVRTGQDKDKIKDTLRTEFAAPDGTPPKADSIRKAIDRASDKLSATP